MATLVSLGRNGKTAEIIHDNKTKHVHLLKDMGADIWAHTDAVTGKRSLFDSVFNLMKK